MRFLDWSVPHSAAPKISLRTKADFARYLLNYTNKDGRYSEQYRNCQHFAADLFGLLTGQNIAPFHPVSRVFYQNHTSTFLYDN